MSESKQKKKTMYNQDALNILAERFGFTHDYLRKSLRGDRVGILPDQVKAEYAEITAKLKRTVHTIKHTKK